MYRVSGAGRFVLAAISLVGLRQAGVRYDFTGHPAGPGDYQPVDLAMSQP